jgi:metacaspase-1
MASGSALTIGLNSVDPGHYAGWSGDLNACEADAADMANIATSKGFTVTTLLTKEATRQRVQAEISAAADRLEAGDFFMLSYSGHGGQLPDLNDEEVDAQDDTWCLYDGELVDDEVYTLLARFAEGVRVLVFSDSCHSRTVTQLAYYEGTVRGRSVIHSASEGGYRHMPQEVILPTYRNNKDFYDEILRNLQRISSQPTETSTACSQPSCCACGVRGHSRGTTRSSTRRSESACLQTRPPITSERDKSTSNLKLRLRLRSNWQSGAAWEKYHQREGGA